MRPSRDAWAMAMAVLTAQRTTCVRRAVGCVLLSDRGHVLSTGNNGVAAGMRHCNEECQYRGQVFFPFACKGHALPPGQDSCEAIHAEQNALLQCRDVYLVATAYVTLSPCLACAKLLLNTSCKRIVFLDEFEKPEAKDLWLRADRTWEKFDPSDLQGLVERL